MADFFAFFTIWTIVALNHGHFLTEYPLILIGSLLQLVLLLAFRVYRIITLHFGILDAVKLFNSKLQGNQIKIETAKNIFKNKDKKLSINYANSYIYKN